MTGYWLGDQSSIPCTGRNVCLHHIQTGLRPSGYEDLRYFLSDGMLIWPPSGAEEENHAWPLYASSRGSVLHRQTSNRYLRLKYLRIYIFMCGLTDRLCGLVVRVSRYRSRGPGSIPGITRSSVKLLSSLQIQRSRFDSRNYQIFWEVAGLERGPIEELLLRNSSCSGLEIREYGYRDLLYWPRNILYPQKLALTLPTRGRRSVGILRLSTQATEFVFCFFVWINYSFVMRVCFDLDYTLMFLDRRRASWSSV
jgi:hypothetical protein